MHAVIRFLAASGALLLGAQTAVAQPQGPGFPVADPETQGILDHAWLEPLPKPMGEARHFVYHGRRLLAAGDGPALSVARLTPEGFSAEEPAARIAVAGLSGAQGVVAMAASAEGGALVLALEDGSLHVASLGDRAQIGPFSPLPPLPQPRAQAVTALADMEGYVIVLVEAQAVDGTWRTAAWMGDLRARGQEAELFEWIELPFAETARRDYATMTLADGVMLAGGTVLGPSDNRSARQPSLLPLKPPTWKPWTPVNQPLLQVLPEATGAAYGRGIYVAPRPAMDAESTSASLYMAQDLREGRLTAWRQMFLGAPPADTRALVVDPAHNRLLAIMDGEGGSFVQASILPQELQAPRRTLQDAERERRRRMAVRPAPVSPEELSHTAKDSGIYKLVIIASKDEDTEINTRYSFNGAAFRYMTQGSVAAYYDGDRGDELAARYGVGARPAYLVVDPFTEGVMARHEGSVPTREELFRLTSVLRNSSPQNPDAAPDQ